MSTWRQDPDCPGVLEETQYWVTKVQQRTDMVDITPGPLPPVCLCLLMLLNATVERSATRCANHLHKGMKNVWMFGELLRHLVPTTSLLALQIPRCFPVLLLPQLVCPCLVMCYVLSNPTRPKWGLQLKPATWSRSEPLSENFPYINPFLIWNSLAGLMVP